MGELVLNGKGLLMFAMVGVYEIYLVYESNKATRPMKVLCVQGRSDYLQVLGDISEKKGFEEI